MADVKFSTRAYCKMILHCAKYPHCAVNGVLLAESSKVKDSKGDSCLTFVDAIPLFHICLHLSPMYEIALTQIEGMAASEGLIIAGYYLANENFVDTSFETGHKVADKIAEGFPSACIVVIDNKRFPSLYDDAIGDVPLVVSQYSDGKWRTKDKGSLTVDKDILSTACSMMGRKAGDLIDFDNHLDDITLDWKNIRLNSYIETGSTD